MVDQLLTISYLFICHVLFVLCWLKIWVLQMKQSHPKKNRLNVGLGNPPEKFIWYKKLQKALRGGEVAQIWMEQ